MTDHSMRDRISLYLYGELDPEATRELEAELERSPELREALAAEQRFFRGMQSRENEPVSEALLAECRHDIMRQVYRASRTPATQSWWESFIGGLGGMRVAWQPTVALALVALGFWGGRTTTWSGPFGAGGGSGVTESVVVGAPAMPLSAEVQSVQLDEQGGGVEIVIEERRTIRGNPDDPFIRELLLSSVQGSHSGAKLESLEALSPGGADAKVRAALVDALLHDPNPGVRLNALESLAPHSREAGVRTALIEALQKDANPGVRVQAIDLLVAQPDQELAGVLQQVVSQDTNAYVRMRGQRALYEMDAAVEVY